MNDMKNCAAVEHLWECVNSRDLGDLEELIHDDFVRECPQSGELIRGKRNAIAMMAGDPDLPRATTRRIVGRGNLCLAETRLDYVGKTLQAISIYEFRDGKIAREIDYFGDPLVPAAEEEKTPSAVGH